MVGQRTRAGQVVLVALGAVVATVIGGTVGFATADPSGTLGPERTVSSTALHPSPAAPPPTAVRMPTPSATPEASSTATRDATPTAMPDATPTATPDASPRPSASRTVAAPKPAVGTALALLATLSVKGRAPRTGYDRDLFGQPWADVDRNGCDTRNDVLRRDLTGFTLKAGTNGCPVLTGTLRSPYTGRTRPFVRGPGTSTAVQIDHVVSLSDAWQKGAQRLDPARRTAFANDPLNLLAIEGSVNQSKSDGDAATWLPPLKSGRCRFVARQVAVKAKYGLWVTGAERDAIARVLSTCPDQKPPTTGRIALGGGRVVAPQPTPAPEPTAPAPLVGGRTDPRFDTCKAAKATGYGPYVDGRDPEYDWYRDADSDGIVCE